MSIKARKSILTEDDIVKCINRLNLNKIRRVIILRKLKERNLIPLDYNHPKLHYILKILGYFFGDGYLNFIGKRCDGILGFSSKNPLDLVEIRNDIVKIGYTPSKIYFKERNREYFFYVNASSLLVFLHALGAPIGDKTLQKYRVPKWIFRCSFEQKRLFLAALFGAELSKPTIRKNKPTLFANPQLEMAKEVSIADSAKEFLKDITKLLQEFGVEATIYRRKGVYVRKKDGKKTVKFILSIKSYPENLINLWEKIGYEYNGERQELAKLAVAYLKYKRELIERRRKLAEEIKKLATSGFSLMQIKKMLKIRRDDTRFVEEIYHKVTRNIPITEIRLPRSVLSFNQFIRLLRAKRQ